MGKSTECGFDRQSWAVVLLGWIIALWVTLG